MIVLADAVERNRVTEGKFWIPTQEERRSLKPGDYAKVVFEPKGQPGERMWLQVESNLPDGSYLGVLANTPIVIDEAEKGDKIEFRPENVIDIMRN